MKITGKKQTFFLRAAMMVLTTILIVLFFAIMSMVGKIQGTARVSKLCGAGARWHAANGKTWKFQGHRRTKCIRRFLLI